MTSRFEHGGVAITYDEFGDREAPAVVMLHGIMGSRETWTPLAERLDDRFRVLTVDFRGHGDSDRTPGGYTMPAYGDDVIALCEGVLGGPAAFVGHSLGGVMSAYIAQTRPELARGILMEDPPLFILEPDVFRTTVYATLFPMLRDAIRAAQATDDPAAALVKVLESARSIRGEGTIADVLGPEGTAVQAHSWARFDTAAMDAVLEPAPDATTWGDHDPDTPIRCPVAVVRADPNLQPAFFAEHEERLRQLAPHATFAVAERCSHLIHNEDPAWFDEQVEAFLKEL